MHRTPLLVAMLFAAPGAVGCFQELDPNVTGGSVAGDSKLVQDAGLIYAVNGTCPAGMIAAGSDGVNSDASPNMGHGVCVPVDSNTPTIQTGEQDDAAATDDPCAAVTSRSLDIRTTHCAGCHDTATAGQPMGGFGWVLDDNQLLMNGVSDNSGKPLIIAGDPDHSKLYIFVATGTMPKKPLPSLSVSDVSILRAWIDCKGSGSSSGGSQDDAGGGGGGGPTPADAGAAPVDGGKG
jgi:hypothetical protein